MSAVLIVVGVLAAILLIVVAVRMIQNAGYGWCERCGKSWRRRRPHVVHYRVAGGPTRGIFAVCEECWHDATVDELIVLHHRVVAQWHYASEQTRLEHRNVLEVAVRDGKSVHP